jgi:hypothetical protein
MARRGRGEATIIVAVKIKMGKTAAGGTEQILNVSPFATHHSSSPNAKILRLRGKSCCFWQLLFWRYDVKRISTGDEIYR